MPLTRGSCTAVLQSKSTGAFHAAGSTFLRITVPLAVALALCNMDRIVLSVAILPIAQEFGFDIAAQVQSVSRLKCS